MSATGTNRLDLRFPLSKPTTSIAEKKDIPPASRMNWPSKPTGESMNAVGRR
jgi:hypothetical protein